MDEYWIWYFLQCDHVELLHEWMITSYEIISFIGDIINNFKKIYKYTNANIGKNV